MHVMLRRDWPGTFSRTIRDADGNAIERLTFTPGEVVEIRPIDLRSLRDDIGRSLLPMEFSEEFRKYVILDVNEIDLDRVIAEVDAENGGATAESPTDRQRVPQKPKRKR